jgi:membrane-anchored protein YejM (alkaline phosphatase superfamily)
MAYTTPFLFDKLLGQLFMSILGGNTTLIALVIFLFFGAFGIALRLTWEMQLISMFFLSFIVISGLGLVSGLDIMLMIVVGFALGAFLFYTLLRG